MLKVSTPLKVALVWILSSTISFSPLVTIAKNPNAGMGMFQGVVAVAALIVLVPWLFTLTIVADHGKDVRKLLWPTDVIGREAWQRIDRTRSVEVLRRELRNVNAGARLKASFFSWSVFGVGLEVLRALMPERLGPLLLGGIFSMIGMAFLLPLLGMGAVMVLAHYPRQLKF